jgi:hypothetical protein
MVDVSDIPDLKEEDITGAEPDLKCLHCHIMRAIIISGERNRGEIAYRLGEALSELSTGLDFPQFAKLMQVFFEAVEAKTGAATNVIAEAPEEVTFEDDIEDDASPKGKMN